MAIAVAAAVGLSNLLGLALGSTRSLEDSGQRDKLPEEAPPPSARPHRGLRSLRGPLGWVLYLGLIAAAILLGPRILSWALDSPYPLATITSGSMWPTLKEGDIVLIQGVDSIDDLKVGDIIAFRHKDGMAIHRIIKIEDAKVTTRGDANSKPDEPITFEDVIGRALEVRGWLVKVPYLGYLARLIGPALGSVNDSPGVSAEASLSE